MPYIPQDTIDEVRDLVRGGANIQDLADRLGIEVELLRNMLRPVDADRAAARTGTWTARSFSPKTTRIGDIK